MNEYEQKLLAGWEDVYKMGQLSLWIMLALKDGAKHMNQIKDFVLDATDGVVAADDKSMYRSLRRYNDSELITYEMIPGEGGPALKQYRLTETGQRVLQAFLQRNIHIFFKDPIRQLLHERSH